MTIENRVANSLLLLRIGVFIVMLVWTLDKFVQPDHAGLVYENFYGIGGLGAGAFIAIGIAELLLVCAFAAGYGKRFTYGAVLVIHAISTLSSWRQYLAPFEHLLFFAAWPMLAACIVLYYLRDLDTRWTLDGVKHG
jgi:hypothetical protein